MTAQDIIRAYSLFDLFKRGVIKIPVLSILIPTVIERNEDFIKLHAAMVALIRKQKLHHQIEIVYLQDNKEISIGAKRQKLLELAKGDWIVFFDDDDKLYKNYIADIYNAIINNPGIDCIGIVIDMLTNGANPQTCCHRLAYPEWKDNVDGYNYVRNITHRNPVKRQLAMQVGFEDLRFGEDKLYSDKITQLCTKEFFIEQPNFLYNYSTAQPHNQKYGITNGSK